MTESCREVLISILRGERKLEDFENWSFPEAELDETYNLLLELAWKLRAHGVGAPMDAKFALVRIEDLRMIFPELLR